MHARYPVAPGGGRNESAGTSAPMDSPQPGRQYPPQGNGGTRRNTGMTLYSITKTVSIDASAVRVFEFMADIANWPRWAIVNIQKVAPYDGEWWEVVTAAGTALLRIRSNVTFGILDHDFDASNACWTVPARVVPNGTGSELMITFMQPRRSTREAFEKQMTLVDWELERLKRLMEAVGLD